MTSTPTTTQKPVATLRGYTAQARYYHANMAVGTDGETWVSAGWLPRGASAPRPAFRLKDGRAIVIVDGANHLTVIVYQVHATDLKPTEDDCYPPRTL